MPNSQSSTPNANPFSALRPGRGARRGLRARRAERCRRPRSRAEDFFLGCILVVVGLVFWGLRQDSELAERLVDWWPMLLVWVGLGKLVSGRVAGATLFVLGGVLLQLDQFGRWDIEATWPIGLVAVGLVVTIGALFGRGTARRVEETEGPEGNSGDAP